MSTIANPKDLATIFGAKIEELLKRAQKPALEIWFLGVGIVAVYQANEEDETRFVIYYDKSWYQLLPGSEEVVIADAAFAIVGVGLLNPGQTDQVEQLLDFAKQYLQPAIWKDQWSNPAE
ncbi:MAG: hypothetical protein WCW26_01325 [Candidatus Buchananbacteria bacterium]